MRMLTRSLLLILAIAVPLPVMAQSARPARAEPSIIQTAPNWHRFAPPEEEFAVLLPVLPESYTDRDVYLRLMGEKISERVTYSAYAEGAVFLLLSYKAANPNQVLEELLDFRPSSAFERDISLDGFSGKQYRVAADHYSLSRYFVTRRKVYVITVVAREESNPAAARFLASFRLGNGRAETMTGETPNERGAIENRTADSPTSAAEAGQQPERIFRATEVSRRAVVAHKPEPAYTEAARRNEVTGRVVLRAVLSASGEVTNIVPVERLEYGLTEQSIAAARRMKFLPAEIDGRPVSQYVQIIYNFNMY